LYVTAKPYDPVGRRVKREDGLPGQAYTAGKPVRIDDYPRFTRTNAITTNIRVAMAVPFLWQGEITGVITFTRQEANRPFSDDDEQIAVLLAAQIAAAVANINLLQETQNRVDELSTLNQVGQSLAAQVDLPGLYDALRREITRALNTQSFQIALYDADTGMAELPYIYRSGDVSSLSSAPLGEGLTSIVIRNRKPLRLASREEAIAQNISGAVNQAAQSYLGVPIMLGDRILGMIAAQDNDRTDRFTEAHERLLLTIASQVGLAVQNLRLLEQTRRRASELASINRITTAATSFRDLQSMLEGVAKEVMLIFSARNSGIALLDPTATRLTVIADANRDPQAESSRGIVIPVEGNLSSQQVIETKKSLIIANPKKDPLTESIHELMKARNTECLMIVPLTVRGEVLGTIAIDTDERGRTFTEAEMVLCETLVAQVSTALDNNRLFEQTRRRADQLTTAAEVARTAISTLDPDELIIRTAELIRERFNLYYAAIFVIDEDRQWAVLRYATGEAGRTLMERKHRLEIGGQSMVSSALTTRRARIALDVGQEAVRFNNPLLPDTHSEMAIPLIVGDSPLGALDVQSTEFNAFSDDDVIVLQTMADQIAVSIQNARLYLATERRVRLEQLINRISGKLRRAVDADSIMNAALSELQDVLGARRVVAQLGPEQLLRSESTPPVRLIEPANLPPPPDPIVDGNGHSNGNGHHNGNGYNGNGNGNGHEPDMDSTL
jgi:GAF domain-containing protein